MQAFNKNVFRNTGTGEVIVKIATIGNDDERDLIESWMVHLNAGKFNIGKTLFKTTPSIDNKTHQFKELFYHVHDQNKVYAIIRPIGALGDAFLKLLQSDAGGYFKAVIEDSRIVSFDFFPVFEQQVEQQ